MYQFIFLYRLAVQALRTVPLRLMLLAQALAIAAQLSVLLTADQYQQLFNQEAAALLGGDIVVSADREPSLTVLRTAQSLGLTVAKTTLFNSVALSLSTVNPQQTLVSAKAVDASYPLRGKVSLSKVLAAQNNSPKIGQVWVDADLLTRLNLVLGDKLQLGEQQFIIAAVIDNEPDRGVQFINVAPRVLFAQADLVKTKLLGAGSRVSYRWQMTGSLSAQAQFKQWLILNPVLGLRLETLDEGRPEMRTTLDRASRLLGLIAILTTLIAACGLSLVAHIWSQEQAKTVALLRTLGASRYHAAWRLLGQVAAISVLGLCLGYVLGYALHRVLAYYLLMARGLTLPTAGYLPYLQALCLLIILLLSCVWIPVNRLLNTRPIQILREQSTATSTLNTTNNMINNTINQSSIKSILNKILNKLTKLMPYLVALVGISLILMWVAGDIKQGLLVLIGLLSVIVTLLVFVYSLIKLAVNFGRKHAIWTVRMASRGILRNQTLTLVQATSLTLALLGLLMLTSLQRDVLSAWQNVLPANAPNHFILNIQPDQANAVKKYLLDLGIADVRLQPMIRARLVNVNKQPINAEQYTDQRAKNLLNREFNMSYTTQLPKGNTVLAGRWHGDITQQFNNRTLTNQISMEEGILKSLNLKLGDVLTFDVAGQNITYTLTSVRKLRWESLNVNFFAIASPNSTPISASDLPQTYISAVFVPANLGDSILSMVRTFLNLTVLDVGAISAQATGVLNKVARALTLLLTLSGVAGIVVVSIIAYASRLARQKETVLLRVLGASAAQVRAAQLLEQALVGGIAGFTAGIGSYALVQALAEWVLNLPINIGFWPIGAGILLGISANILGYFALEARQRSGTLNQQARALGV
jgi:putative ABC transport system permease protein